MFNKLFGPKNITKDWLYNPDNELLLNLDSHELTGMKVGCELDICRFLGQGQPLPHISGYLFPQLGVWLDNSDNKLDCFGVCFTNTFDELPTQIFTGKIIWKSQTITITNETTLDELSKIFGDPYKFDKDEDEIVAFYAFNDMEWQFEADPDGHLMMLMICQHENNSN